MGLMAQFVDRLGVMYAGRLVETAPIAEIITRPRSPLYAAVDLQPAVAGGQRGTLHGIPGLAPLLRDLPSGCAFHPALSRCADTRCQHGKAGGARDRAREVHVACHHAEATA